MKKSAFALIALALVTAGVTAGLLFGGLAVFPGSPSYFAAKASFNAPRNKIVEYEYADERFNYGSCEVDVTDYSLLLAEEYELFSSNADSLVYKRTTDNDPSVIAYINSHTEPLVFFSEDMYVDEKNGVEITQSQQKVEELKDSFIKMYGVSPDSYYACKKAALEIEFSDFELRDKQQSALCLVLMSVSAQLAKENAVCSFVENDELNGIATEIHYESTGRTLVSFEFYPRVDTNIPHYISFMCENESELTDAYKSINSIVFK